VHCPSRLMWVHSEKNSHISMFNNQYWFHFHETFYYKARLWHFGRNTPQENVKNTRCSLVLTIATSEFLYLITNQAIDAVKAIVHTVNMKLRKKCAVFETQCIYIRPIYNRINNEVNNNGRNPRRVDKWHCVANVHGLCECRLCHCHLSIFFFFYIDLT